MRRWRGDAQSPPSRPTGAQNLRPCWPGIRMEGAGTSPAAQLPMINPGRSLSILPLLFVLAGPSCGSESQPPEPVTALSDSDAQALCQQFFVAACDAGLRAKGDPACTACDPCSQAASLATIRSKCGDGITDLAVRHCMSSHF